MKSSNLILVMLLFCFSVNGQTTDSLKQRKNEIGINTLPLLNVFSGAIPTLNSRYSINYRHYLNNKNAIRISASFFPFNDASGSYKGFPSLVALSDTNLIYKNVYINQIPRLQLNAGYEFVFVRKRLIQSFGGELFFNYQQSKEEENYYATGKSSPLNTDYPINLLNAHLIDTMGHTSLTKKTGIGMQLFYNVRLPISKRWLISATCGPNFSFIYNQVRYHDRKTGKTDNHVYNSFDFDGTLFTDLSIAFRF